MRRGRWEIILPSSLSEDEIRRYCASCRDESRRLGKPSEKAMNCWKTIYATDDAGSFNKAVEIIKQIIPSTKCWVEYSRPEPYTNPEGSIIIICWNWDDMWSLRDTLIRRFMDEGILKEPYLPYRRAGNYYDKEYGPWRLWALRYYPERLKVSKITSAKAICPNDGVPMDLERKGLKCGLCGLYIPETTLYEAVENGFADIMIRQGSHRGEVYRIQYVGVDRFIITRLRAPGKSP